MKAWLDLPVLRQLFAQELWNIGLTMRSAAQILQEGELGPVEWWRSPGITRLRADPIGILGGDPLRQRVYFEELSLWTGRGIIRSVGYDGGTCHDDVRDELVLNVHLSYPFLIVKSGEPLMMPEMHESGQSKSFGLEGGRWMPRRTYMSEVQVLDPTPFELDGTWYLFYTVAGATANTVLHLSWGEDPEGPWQVHPASPMPVGPIGARPAGPLFRVGNRLFRPAQDSSEGYGCGLVIHEVLRLDRATYIESRALALRPNPDAPYPNGLHSFVPCGNRVFVDGKRRAFIAWASIYKAISLWRTSTRGEDPW